MIRSESITKIAPALVKVQALIASAEKSAVNPHLKNKYANLGDVMAAVKPALETNKLMFMQTPVESDDGKLHLETLIIHESGEYIGGVLVMPLPKQDPQGYGSALTYAKRYHLSSILGVNQDDDDGNAARGSTGSYVSAIDACEDMATLQDEFKRAVGLFKGDSAAIKVITDAKDKKKAELAVNKENSFNPAKVAPKEKISQPANTQASTDSEQVEDF